ncbi:hypothetical protein FGO68_gene13003 [Halteria grandinella]|uniref:Uncharacterized protein n=1 Tax=Halteria grandinella TaxID=5974 RepID=A0A8J8NAA1_HALGN|nr:hypothetical protein FGO68_gene13003 [Halteria grandinella]
MTQAGKRMSSHEKRIVYSMKCQSLMYKILPSNVYRMSSKGVQSITSQAGMKVSKRRETIASRRWQRIFLTILKTQSSARQANRSNKPPQKSDRALM